MLCASLSLKLLLYSFAPRVIRRILSCVIAAPVYYAVFFPTSRTRYRDRTCNAVCIYTRNAHAHILPRAGHGRRLRTYVPFPDHTSLRMRACIHIHVELHVRMRACVRIHV